MQRIYQYDLPSFRESNVAALKLHAGAAIIHVDEIGKYVPGEGPGARMEYGVHLWAIVDPYQPVETRRFWLVRDGDVLSALGDDPWLYHIGSWRSVSGTLWQHLFEITHVPEYDPPKRERKGGLPWRRRRTQRSSASTKPVTGSA